MEQKKQDFQNLRNAEFNEIINLSNGDQVRKTNNCFDEPDCAVCCLHDMCETYFSQDNPIAYAKGNLIYV